MRTNPFFIFLMSCVGLFSACSTDETPVEPEPDPQPEVKPVDPPVDIEFPNGKTPEVSLKSKGGKEEIHFYTTGPWKAELVASEAAAWITFSPSSGDKGYHVIELVIEENQEVGQREAVLQLITKDEKKELTISQGEKKVLEVDKDSVNLKYEGGSFQVKVKANVAYEVQVDADWITRQTSKALSEEQLTFVVGKNGRHESRVGKIVLKAKEGSLSQTVTVTQTGKDSSVDDWEDGNNDWWKPDSSN